MQNHPSRLAPSGALAAGLILLAACSTSETTPYTSGTTSANGTTGTPGATNGTTGTSGGTVASATTTGATTTGATTTGAATTGVGGATAAGATVTGTTVTGATTTATTGAAEMTCATRPMLTVPLIANFEDYDGVTAAIDYGFPFNDDGTGVSVLYGGFYEHSDGSGTPSLVMVAGNGSSYAVSGSNTSASAWGGGVGMYLGCMNASSYTGISLAVRGSTPAANSAGVALTAEGLAEGVSTDITLTDTFAVVQLPFTGFTNDGGETTNGDNITGLSVNAHLNWVEDPNTPGSYIPEAGAYEVVVDDISFY